MTTPTLINRVSRGFWRSTNGRFDILESREFQDKEATLNEDTHYSEVYTARVEVKIYVIYDCDLGKRKVFDNLDDAFDFCLNAKPVVDTVTGSR